MKNGRFFAILPKNMERAAKNSLFHSFLSGFMIPYHCQVMQRANAMFEFVRRFIIMSELNGACVIGQSGGPTSVINSSVLGAIETALDTPAITRVFGMAHGIKGLLNDELYDIDKEDRDELALLRYTPSSA